MAKPYAIVSDLHFHNWSAFSTTTTTGTNSRLEIALAELERAAAELAAAGGDLIVIAGDMFHVRGSIDPEVFNPVHQAIEALILKGFRFAAIPGNHDLKGKDATELGNAFQSMSGWSEFRIHLEPKVDDLLPVRIAFVPWRAKTAELLKDIEELAGSMNKDALDETDLIIHAGIDGVMPNLPDHGLTAAQLASFGFRRVFAGHYHNHKVMEDGKVVSIGATTQQTWSDLGAKAGFLLVWPDRFEHRAANSPDFIEITGDVDEDEIPLLVDGNYVRIRGMKLTDAEINIMRGELKGMGARGVTFQVTRETVSARTGAVATKSVSLEASIDSYVDTLTHDDLPAIKAQCGDIMTKVRSIQA